MAHHHEPRDPNRSETNDPDDDAPGAAPHPAPDLDAELDATLAGLAGRHPRRRRGRRTAAGVLLGGALLAGGVVGSTALPSAAIPCCVGDPGDPWEPPLPPPTTRPPTTTPPTTTPPPTTATWFVDANVLRVRDAQEESWYSNGDEFYVAQIGFRSTPGRPGSTQAWYQGGLTEITGMDDNDVATIPDSMGRVSFPNVTLRGTNDVLAGNNPEVIGSISVAFESDWTSFGTIGSMMNDVRAAVRTQIAALVEPLTLLDLANPELMAQRLAATTSSIKSATKLTTWQKITTFLSSFGDPDDKIGFKAQVFVAADPSLSGLIDSQLGMNVPTDVGTAGALRDRTFVENFAGDGASYDLTFRVSR